MVFGRCRVGLREFNTSKGDVRAARCHSPNQFANTRFIFYLHFVGELCLFFGVCRANSGAELFDPGGVGREWSGTIFCHWDFVEPSIKIFVAEFIGSRMAVNFDVIAGLCNVNTIEHVEKTLPFKRDREVVVYPVKELQWQSHQPGV